MIGIICVILSAMCNAIMDISVQKWHKSIFQNWNPYWWNGNISWKSKYKNHDPLQGRRKIKLFGREIKLFRWSPNLPVQITDAFHFFKMIMLFAFAAAWAYHQPITNNPVFEICLFGLLWIAIFDIFYNYLLIKKS